MSEPLTITLTLDNDALLEELVTLISFEESSRFSRFKVRGLAEAKRALSAIADHQRALSADIEARADKYVEAVEAELASARVEAREVEAPAPPELPRVQGVAHILHDNGLRPASRGGDVPDDLYERIYVAVCDGIERAAHERAQVESLKVRELSAEQREEAEYGRLRYEKYIKGRREKIKELRAELKEPTVEAVAPAPPKGDGVAFDYYNPVDGTVTQDDCTRRPNDAEILHIIRALVRK